MTFLRHVWILTQKNFHILKRSKIWFFCELLFGLLLLPLFIFVVSKSTSEVKPPWTFNAVHITGDQSDLMRNVNNIQRISTRMCNARKNFGYVTVNDIGDAMMRDFESRYSHFKVPINVTRFPTLHDMKTALLDDLNMTSTKQCGNFLGGVHLSELDVNQKKFKYTIYVRDRGGVDWNTDDFWPSDGPYGTLSDLNDIPGKPNYWSSGFLTFQYALDTLFLQKIGKNTSMEVFLWRLPTPRFRNSGLLAILTSMPILFIFLVMAVMIHTTKEVVAEKEAGIKTHLMVMGLDSAAFYASHFLTALFKIFIVVGISAIVLSVGFEDISPSIFVVFCILFGIAAVLFSILISVLCRRTTIAICAVFLLWFGLFCLDVYLKVSPTQIGTCMLASLNVYSAFHFGLLAMGSYESRLIPLTWFKLFNESTTSFSIGLAFMMLIVDILIFCFLIYYLDAVWPTDNAPRKSPLFIFPFIRPREVGGNIDLDEPDTINADYFERDSSINRDEPDISVQNMSKVWENSQVAVSKLSLTAHRGEVTVLLGHNGAGKSTTFSVISGVCSASRGEVYICQKPISSNIEECQKQIGYCPQTNPLFAKLTVEEHLRLYGKLKTDVWDATSEEKLKDLIAANQLTDKTNELAEDLSGGMKRKLCVAMSLVGGSRVVLLDEPTAGMDPEARHHICAMLEREKKNNRTILLTTHYMDEADLLGDRIAIMVKGKLVCKGSSKFLKDKFGTGYILTLVVAPNERLPEDGKEKETILEGIRVKLLKVVKKYVHQAEIESRSGLQFSVILPTDSKQYFADMFVELEAQKENLQISSFGLSHNTLEQVFLKVGELAHDEDDLVDGQAVSRAQGLFHSDDRVLSKPVQFIKQVVAIFQRYATGAYRNKVRTLLPLIVAVLLFSIVAFFQNRSGKLQKRDLSLIKQEPLTIPMQSNQQQQIPADFAYIAGKLPSSIPLTISPHDDFRKMILRHAYDSPALGFGSYVAENGSAFILFNGAAYHSPPLALSFLSNAILQEKADSIQASVDVYSPDLVMDVTSVVTPVATIFVNILTILCFSFFTSMFVMPLVEDRVSRFKHQLLLTNLNRVTYWFAVTLWNFAIYFVFCLILASILFISGWMQACMNTNLVFWALYFWSSVPFVYVSSFIFSSPLKAFVALLTWNVIAGIIASIATTIVTMLGSPDLANFLTTAFSVILPSYALGYGVMEVTMQCPVLGRIVRWDNLNKVMICMTISGIFFWILLVLFEHTLEQIIYSLARRFQQGKYVPVNTKEDADVLSERSRMEDLTDDKLALSVRDVSKYYKDFCALRNLTFGVDPTDCFGLLGINGAGKTTTFDIITGRKFASNGYAFINGVDIRKMPPIGYCPQFDALASDLTGRQTLTILGQLNGFADVADRVDSVLESIHMHPQADKLVLHYSGGQKRRLSIGVTLMSRASLIMLDEPTAGIDPKTRRHIWNLLKAVRVRKEIAILLTSHSMDECEALCSRIGFLNKGSLISIGTSQHLKSRYGNSFLLTFTVENPNKHNCDVLNAEVKMVFGEEVKPTQDVEHMPTYHWDIPRQGNDSWSTLYKGAQAIAKKYSIKPPLEHDLPIITDFSVTQNSLEQVFLRLTQLGATMDEHQTRVSPRSVGHLSV